MPASNVSSNVSTAWQTALTSAKSSNVNGNVQPAGNAPPSHVEAASRSSYANMARLAEAGGYGSSNASRPQVPRVPQRPPSASSASSSSSFTSSHGYADDTSTTGEIPSPTALRNNGSDSNHGQTGQGWRGSASINGQIPNPSAYAQASSRSSSRASSVAPSPPVSYADTTLARTSSQSGLSGTESEGYSSRSRRGGYLSSSRSQTSVDSEGPAQIAAQQTAVLRQVVRPVVDNVSEWEDAWKSISVDKKKKARDEAELAAGIEALGLNPDLTERKQPSRATPNLPPPPSTGAWTFKKTIDIPRGATVDPERLRGPSPEYLAEANTASNLLPLTSFVGKRPKLLVLDLNQTLVTRKKATTQAAKNALPRPYLSAFLEYVCGSDEVSEGILQRRFNVMIWSSAEAANVQAMCENMLLLANAGAEAPLLIDLWDRGSMDLTLEQFHSKFPTIKDLNKVWRILKWNPVDPASPNPALLQPQGHSVPSPAPSPAPSSVSSASTATYTKKDLRWSQRDTILIDDTPSKASLQPFNHLSIPSWKPPSKIGVPPAGSRGASYPSNNGGMMGPGEHKVDTCLVQLVGMLERLRHHTNVSAAIKSCQFEGLGKDERGDSWARLGFDVLKKKGIKPVKDFDSTWSIRVLQKNAAASPSPAGPSASNTIRPPAASPSVGLGWD